MFLPGFPNLNKFEYEFIRIETKATIPIVMGNETGKKPCNSFQSQIHTHTYARTGVCTFAPRRVFCPVVFYLAGRYSMGTKP